MKNKYQALFWEQNRVAAPAVGMCLLTGALVMLLTAYPMRDKDFGFGALLLTLLGGIGVLLLRNNHEAHLVAAFERRLARLPMHTSAIVTIPLLVRLAYLVVLSLALHGVYYVLYGEPIRFVIHNEPAPLAFFMLPLTLYLAAQAVAWSGRTITGGSYFVPLLILLAPLPVLFLGDWPQQDQHYLTAMERTLTMLLYPSAQAVLCAIFYGLAFAGVYLERRDARVGLPTLRELWEWLMSRDDSPRTGFASQAEAQLWYERKRAVLALPLLSLVFLALLLCLRYVFPGVAVRVPTESNISALFSTYTRWSPAIALVLAALPASLRTLWARSQFTLLRPQTSMNIARAKMLIAAESILTAVAILALCTVIITLNDSFAKVLLESYRHSEISLFNVLAVLFGPLFCAALVAWTLMASPRLVKLMALTLAGYIALTVILLGMTRKHEDELGYLAMALAAVVLICIPIALYLIAVRSNMFTRVGYLAPMAIWAVLGLFLWTLGPPAGPTLLTLLVALVPAGLAIAPFLSLPVEIQSKRHT